MKAILLASTIAVGVLGFAAPSFALMNGHNAPDQFGPVMEMKVNDHMMHMQLIDDGKGGQWVVMSREEFEQMTGMNFGGHTATKLN